MSSGIDTATVTKSREELPWALWARQANSILMLEVKKNFWGKRAILIYLLTLLPVFLCSAIAIIPPLLNDAATLRAQADPTFINTVFSSIYELLILRTVIFFGCAWIFMNLFRGEVVDRSLHYYFLSPLRREVLVIAKYLSGLLTALTLFISATVISLFLLYLPLGASNAMQRLFEGGGLKSALTYVAITILACIGYGAVFLLIGLLFRNPIVPALAVYGWEFINFLLPPLLKKLSVIHYLQSLQPLPLSEGPFAIVAEPTPPWVAVPTLLLMAGLVLAFACLQVRRMQIRYGGE
jgi:ABC-type transport system involved in multi-copper enzyme maturation permease subunit